VAHIFIVYDSLSFLIPAIECGRTSVEEFFHFKCFASLA
jgi:hypothetical protein